MFSRLLKALFMQIYTRFFETKVRRGSLQAVRGYIKAVEYVRLGLIGLVALGATAALLVSGVILLLMGLLALAPLEPTTLAVLTSGIGIVFILIAGIMMAIVFSQKRWLEMSRSYDLLDIALSPWPNAVPPNPLKVIRSHKREEAYGAELDRVRKVSDLAMPTEPSPT